MPLATYYIATAFEMHVGAVWFSYSKKNTIPERLYKNVTTCLILYGAKRV